MDFVSAKIGGLNTAEVTAKKTPVKTTDLRELYGKTMALPRLLGEYGSPKYLSYVQLLCAETSNSFKLFVGAERRQRLLIPECKWRTTMFTDFFGDFATAGPVSLYADKLFPLVREGNAYSFLGGLQPVHPSQRRSGNCVNRYALSGILGELHQTKLVKYLRPCSLISKPESPFKTSAQENDFITFFLISAENHSGIGKFR